MSVTKEKSFLHKKAISGGGLILLLKDESVDDIPTCHVPLLSGVKICALFLQHTLYFSLGFIISTVHNIDD